MKLKAACTLSLIAAADSPVIAMLQLEDQITVAFCLATLPENSRQPSYA